jgi:hypothetical protein
MAYATKEKERENKRIYYLKHRKVILERAKKWNKENRPKANLNKKNYLMKKKREKITKQILKEIKMEETIAKF